MDLRKIEKEIQERARLAPVFFKNPNRPTARLLNQVRRQANFIKTASHSQYEEMIEKVMSKSPKLIKQPKTQLLNQIIESLTQDIQKRKNSLVLDQRDKYQKLDQMITLKTLISHTHNQQSIRNKSPQSNFPRIIETPSSDSQRVLSIITACSKQNKQLEKIHRFVNQKKRFQNRRFSVLYDQIGQMSLQE